MRAIPAAYKIKYASMAQLVEQLIRNEQAVGSSPTTSLNGKIPRKYVVSEGFPLCMLRDALGCR